LKTRSRRRSSNQSYSNTSPATTPKSDEPRYCSKNVVTPRATNFTYQPRVCTNLDVTVIYTKVEVRVLPVVIAYLERDHRGSKLDFYRVRRSLILMKGEKIYSKGELLYCRNEEKNMQS